MAKKKKKTFIEGVTGIGGSSLDERYLAKHDHGTFYGGLQITEEIKEELEAQPISDFMYFEPKGKSYIMKYQIPEKECWMRLNRRIQGFCQSVQINILRKFNGNREQNVSDLKIILLRFQHILLHGEQIQRFVRLGCRHFHR